MKKLFALTAVLAFAVAAMAQETEAGKAAEMLGDSFSKGSLKNAGELISDKASIYWVDAKRNKEGLGKFLAGQIRTFNKRALLFNEESGIDTERISTSWGSFFIEYGAGNGTPSNRQTGRYTVIAEKKDGKWQIVSLHLSLPFPPELPDPIK